MRNSSNSEAMRALSNLYRLEAERLEHTETPEIAKLKAQLLAVQSSRAALDREIRSRGLRPSRPPGVSHDRALKILTVTFALTALAGFLAAMFFDSPKVPSDSPLAPLKVPTSSVVPSISRIENRDTKVLESEPSPSKASVVPPQASRTKKTPLLKQPRDKTAVKDGKTGKKDKEKDGFEFLDKCGDDPMCGFDKKSKDGNSLK